MTVTRFRRGLFSPELDANDGTERLYLGGDAYSAPAVYVKEDNVWNIYYLCRDYLGSITPVVDANGSLTSEYSYSAWGSLRDPDTWELLENDDDGAALSLGRGYTGHEHLPWFGLINMNARLYDPALGRFLSPDPYVQAPDFSQAFNRYSYALNNPLKYQDESGEKLILSKRGDYYLIGWSFEEIGIPLGFGIALQIGKKTLKKQIMAMKYHYLLLAILLFLNWETPFAQIADTTLFSVMSVPSKDIVYKRGKIVSSSGSPLSREDIRSLFENPEDVVIYDRARTGYKIGLSGAVAGFMTFCAGGIIAYYKGTPAVVGKEDSGWPLYVFDRKMESIPTYSKVMIYGGLLTYVISYGIKIHYSNRIELLAKTYQYKGIIPSRTELSFNGSPAGASVCFRF